MPYESRTISVNITRPLDIVTRFLSDPSNFPSWASGLAGGLALSDADSDGDAPEWVASSSQGPIRVRFSPPNTYGVADHWVLLPDGATVYVPLRAVANGDGTHVALTLFRAEGMDDARFEVDAEWVARDLARLRTVLEAG